MSQNTSIHTFHIPVMGLAFTIDSPIRVAQYGISSAISITDDDLIERMRAFYCKKFDIPYKEITQKIHDYRAERITSYLNMVDNIVQEKFEKFKNELVESRTKLESFLSMLPNTSEIKNKLQSCIEEGKWLKDTVATYIEEYCKPGNIDVNIMTKVDKDNFEGKQPLPVEFNDAHASLRGFANSNLEASVVLSAGMNPRLFSYFESFPDFFPDTQRYLKKSIILKVSDYRSALIQGSFLAKKGLWVSEYRIESGLNCGGHAFATDGYLLGVILQEFKDKKSELIAATHSLLTKALEAKALPVPETPLPVKITAQGGVGTAEEHEFLMQYYELDSVGWGSPFLLVPEATSVDRETRQLLINAKENDFYLSAISPLGVPFNTVKGMTNDFWKQKRIQENKAGSSCPKRFLALSKEFAKEGLCTASKKYQDIQLERLQAEAATMNAEELAQAKATITDKACLCVGLANASYLEHDMPIKGQQQGVVICPGPNLAYFDKEVSLAHMVQHIYGNHNIMTTKDRPNMFIKELKMYVEYLQKEVTTYASKATAMQQKKWHSFKNNLLEGIKYYEVLFMAQTPFVMQEQTNIKQLQHYKTVLQQFELS